MKDSIPDLKFERIVDGLGEGLILLEQYDAGEEGCVTIHPLHLRYMAEQFGITAQGDRQAEKTIATLTRRMILLRERIDFLAHYLTSVSNHDRADLTFEMAYADATADIASEFCTELSEEHDADTVQIACEQRVDSPP